MSLPRRAALAATLAPFLLVREGLAQVWPSRPIVWIVPFAPGGITDINSRLISQPLGAFLGQQIVTENRGGAGGGIGTEMVARSAPDGYTMLYGTQGTLATNPALLPGLHYDPTRDFIPVHGLTQGPLVLVCHPDRPFRNVAELIALAKARPGQITYASPGIGSGPHMAGALFMTEAGIEITHVPYPGSGPALNDLVAGRTDISFDFLTSTRAYLEAGRLRALATTGPDRVAVLLGIPTIAEEGLPGAETVAWSAVMVPRATPAAIVERLAEGFRLAMADPRVVQSFAASGSAALMLSGAPLRDFIAQEVVRWRGVVERSGARAG